MGIRRNFALGVLVVAACALLGIARPSEAAAAGPFASRIRIATRVPSAAGKLVYVADSKSAFIRWKADAGFKVSGKTLTYDGLGNNGDSGAVAPFTTKGLKSFAVEACMKMGPATASTGTSYDIFVRRNPKNGRSGIFAGYDAIAGTASARDVADLFWNGNVDNYVPGAPFKPDSAFHIYRVEVVGTMYRFLIDGQVTVPWTIIKDDNAFNELGLAFVHIPAKVKSFKVLKLPSSPLATQLDTSLLEARAFAPIDITIPPYVGVFEDDNAYAADYNLPATALQSMDRLYGYREEYQNGSTLITHSINVHNSPAGAKAAFDFFVARLKAAQTQVSGYGENDISSSGIGEMAFSIHYQYVYQGATSFVNDVIFQRGDYFESVLVDSSDQSVSQTAITLAQTADKLLQSPHA
jgi:hypothetical protein